MIARAREARLADDEGWRRLLYYRERLVGGETGMVDSEGFYLAPTGQKDPSAELEATLTALFAPDTPATQVDKHARCKFPARLKWLGRKLGFDPATLGPVRCPTFDHWMAGMKHDGMSLVFSSYYTNNPGSLFGHTFLRLHKVPPESGVRAPLLDDVINFSAFPNTNNSLLYVYRGLAGEFPGRFSLLPMYLKIQEYNNAERRDLWEYRLDFKPDEIDSVVRALWELGPHSIDYWYFDENCALMLLKLMETAKPDLTFHPPHPWIIPADTVRAAVAVPGLVTGVDYRPSSMRRFLFHYEKLSGEHKALARATIEEENVDEAIARLQRESPEIQARIVDTAIEYIDYEERLAGEKPAEVFAERRRRLLLHRSTLKVPPLVVDYRPESERPDFGHPTSRLGLVPGVMDGRGFGQVEWRPALHDVLSADDGYANSLALQFWNMTVRYIPEEKALYLPKFELLTIRSLPSDDRYVRAPAWSLELTSETKGGCPDVTDRCGDVFARVGVGTTANLLSGSLLLYALVQAETGVSGERDGYFYGEPRLLAGTIVRLGRSTKLLAEAAAGRKHFRHDGFADDRDASVSLAHTFSPTWETRLSAEWTEKTKELMGVVYFYY